MSLLQIYSSSKTESQKTGYMDFWDYSIVKVDGDFVPSYYFAADNDTATVTLEQLAPTALYNGEIDVVSSTDITATGHTSAYGNSLVYADKQAETLSGIHRLKISLATSPNATIYYSDIFYNINNDISIYIRLSSYEYIRVYRY